MPPAGPPIAAPRPYRRWGARLWTWGQWTAVAVLLVVAWRRLVPDLRLPDLGPAPAVRYATLDGAATGPPAYAGRVVVVNVWATWCPPCIVETPGFVGLAGEFGEAVQFLGIAQDSDPEAVRAFVARHHVPYPILVGSPLTGSAPAARVLPTTLVIDRRGRVRLRHEGLLVAPALRAALRRLVAEQGP